MTPDILAVARGLPNFAISVRQPWAWAIIHGGKDVENRVKRAITMGGMDKHPRLAVHASTGMTREEYEDARDFMASIGVACPHPSELLRGGIIGSVSITGVTKDSDSQWFFGPWALELADMEPCDPIPAGGMLGAFRWQPHNDGLREPLPWMVAWPERPQRQPAVPTAAEPEADLFSPPLGQHVAQYLKDDG